MLPTGNKSIVKKSARSPRKVDAASHKLKSYLHLRQTKTAIIQDTYHSKIETPAELASLGCCGVDCVSNPIRIRPLQCVYGNSRCVWIQEQPQPVFSSIRTRHILMGNNEIDGLEKQKIRSRTSCQ